MNTEASPAESTAGSPRQVARLALSAAFRLFRFKLNSAWLVLDGARVGLAYHFLFR